MIFSKLPPAARTLFPFSLTLLTAAFLVFGQIAPLSAQEAQSPVRVEMLNVDPDNRRKRNLYIPGLIKIQPGETIRFVATDAGHNTASIDGLIPQGAQPWKSPLNEDYELTLTEPGLYAFQCSPHYALGMVGIIIVGDVDLDWPELAQKKMPRRAAKRFKKLLSTLTP